MSEQSSDQSKNGAPRLPSEEFYTPEEKIERDKLIYALDVIRARIEQQEVTGALYKEVEIDHTDHGRTYITMGGPYYDGVFSAAPAHRIQGRAFTQYDDIVVLEYDDLERSFYDPIAPDGAPIIRLTVSSYAPSGITTEESITFLSDGYVRKQRSSDHTSHARSSEPYQAVVEPMTVWDAGLGDFRQGSRLLADAALINGLAS
jgi:hypothetical protein